MDPSISSTLVATSEIDTVMQDNDEAHIEPHLQNGFTEPQVLNQLEDLDLPDSTSEEVSQEDSQASEVVSQASVRQFWLPTGCCYDVRMRLHANADFSQSPHHPEDPRRIEAIMKEFRDADLIYTGPESELAGLLKGFSN